METDALFKFQAVSSMKKYPLPLESGKEATILDGIGKHLKHLVCTFYFPFIQELNYNKRIV